MLKGKIQKVELEEVGYFSGVIRITSSNGEIDEIIVNTKLDKLSVRVCDKNINSYRLTGENLSNRVEKIAGALSGGIFKLDDLGALFYSREENNDVYFKGEDLNYIIKIGEFRINVTIDKENIPHKELSFSITKTV